MSALPVRGSHVKVGGLVHFGRMLDRLRLHAQRRLPADYVDRIGRGLDGRLCKLLEVDYAALRGAVLARVSVRRGAGMELSNGRRPSAELTRYCNGFSKLSEPPLKARGVAGPPGIQTIFDIINVDDGRHPFTTMKPPSTRTS